MIVVSEGHPRYVVAEISINHNGDLAIAKKLIDVAALAGCDAKLRRVDGPRASID